MQDFWKVAVSVAGVGALGAFVLWSLYKQWLKLGIFQRMTKQQQFLLFVLFLVLTFLFACAALITYAVVQTSYSEVGPLPLRLDTGRSTQGDDAANGATTSKAIPRNGSGRITVEKHRTTARALGRSMPDDRIDYTTYRLSGDLSSAKLYDFVVSQNTVWCASSVGLLKVLTKEGQVEVFGPSEGLPGDYVSEVECWPSGVVVSVTEKIGRGGARGLGIFLFTPEKSEWRRVATGSQSFLLWDNEKLWSAPLHGGGVQWRFIPEGREWAYTTDNSGLLHSRVSAMCMAAGSAWFAHTGTNVKNGEFRGGGISRLSLEAKPDQWRTYTEQDGLALAYSCAVAGDEREVWAVHWEEEKGVSVLDVEKNEWTALKHSANGLDIGGTSVDLDSKFVWIGQQGGLIRMGRSDHMAIRVTDRNGLPGYLVSDVRVTPNGTWVSVWNMVHDKSGLVFFDGPRANT